MPIHSIANSSTRGHGNSHNKPEQYITQNSELQHSRTQQKRIKLSEQRLNKQKQTNINSIGMNELTRLLDSFEKTGEETDYKQLPKLKSKTSIKTHSMVQNEINRKEKTKGDVFAERKEERKGRGRPGIDRKRGEWIEFGKKKKKKKTRRCIFGNVQYPSCYMVTYGLV